MLALAVIKWWYGPGWAALARKFRKGIQGILASFSVPILARTLFLPWRRIISYGENNVIASLRAALDNAVSRFVGFAVRFIVIITALLIVAFLSVAAIISIIVWPFLPLLSIGLMVKGLLP